MGRIVLWHTEGLISSVMIVAKANKNPVIIFFATKQNFTNGVAFFAHVILLMKLQNPCAYPCGYHANVLYFNLDF